jgi:seryl-tRNA synthetase
MDNPLYVVVAIVVLLFVMVGVYINVAFQRLKHNTRNETRHWRELYEKNKRKTEEVEQDYLTANRDAAMWFGERSKMLQRSHKLHHKLSTLRENKDQLREKMKLLEHEKTILNMELTAIKDDLYVTKQKQSMAQETSQKLLSKEKDLLNDIETKKSSITALQEQLSRAEQYARKLASDINNIKNEATDREKSFHTHVSKMQKNHEMTVTTYKRQIERGGAELNTLRQELERRNQDMAARIHTINQVRKEFEEYKAQFPLITCNICYEDKGVHEFSQLSRECNHGLQMCNGCAKLHILSKIQNLVHEYVECPVVDCQKAIDVPILKRVLTKEEFTAYDNATTKFLLERDPNYVVCSHCNNGQMLPAQPTVFGTQSVNPCVSCGHCRGLFCRSCKVPWHNGETCEQFQLDPNAPPQVRATNAYLNQRTKKCPRCQAPIEKSSGCEHMTCKCKYEFCYVCLGDWKEQRHQPGCRVSSRNPFGDRLPVFERRAEPRRQPFQFGLAQPPNEQQNPFFRFL